MIKKSRYLEELGEYSFYEKIFEYKFLGDSMSLEDKEKLRNFYVGLKGGAKSGYPPIVVKTRGNLDPRNIVFYIYEPGKTYWSRINTDDASMYIAGCFEEAIGDHLSREKAFDLITKALYKFAKELQIPETSETSYLVNFQNKHVFIYKDGSYEIQDGSWKYYFRHALPLNFVHEDWKDIFPSPRKGKVKLFWDGATPIKNKFFEWLNQTVFRGDYEMILFIQKIFGIVLCTNAGKISGKFYMFYGPPMTCKSSLLKVIESLAGKGGFSNVALDKLGDNVQNAEFEHVLVNVSADSDKLSRQKASNVWGFLKKYSGTLDRVTINPKYIQPYSIRPIAKHYYATNFFPPFIDKEDAEDESFWTRLVLIPCINPFLPKNTAREDTTIIEMINKEIFFIFRFAMDGLIRGLVEGFFLPEPRLVAEYRHKYYEFLKGNYVGRKYTQEFLKSSNFHDIFAKKSNRKGVTFTVIYNKYLEWCQLSNTKPLSRVNLKDSIVFKRNSNLIEVKKTGKGAYYTLAEFSGSF